MSKNTVELVAKFRDNASKGMRRLAHESERASRDRLQRAERGARAQRSMYSSYTRLGIRSEHTIRREIQRTEAAYNRLSRSGRASQRDLARAAQTARTRIVDLNRELATSGRRMTALGKSGSLLGKIGRGAGTAAIGAVAAGSVVAPAVKRTMSYGERLTHLTNTFAAGKSVAEKTAVQSQLADTISKALHEGGGSRESAAEALGILAAANVVSNESAQKILPEIMKTATAAEASAKDVTQLIITSLSTGFKEADIPEILDRAMESGQSGGFELKDMARWLPKQFSLMEPLGIKPTLDNLSSLLSYNQVVRTGAANSDDAGNNVVNLLSKITAMDTFNRSKHVKITGVEGTNGPMDYLSEMQRRQGQGMNTAEAFIDLVSYVTKHDANSQKIAKLIAEAGSEDEVLAILESQKALAEGAALGQLVGDRQANLAAVAILAKEALYKTRVKSNKTAQGSRENAMAFAREQAWFKDEKFNNAKEEAEYKAMKGLTDKLGNVMDKLADAAYNNPQLAAALSGATTALKSLAAAAVAGGAAMWMMKGAGALKGGGGILSSSKSLLKGAAAGTAAAGRSVFSRLGGAIAAGGKSLARGAGSAARFGGRALGAASLALVSPKLNSGEAEQLRQRRADAAAGKPVKNYDFAAAETARQAAVQAAAQQAAAQARIVTGRQGVVIAKRRRERAQRAEQELDQLGGDIFSGAETQQASAQTMQTAVDLFRQVVEQLIQTPIPVSLPEIPIKVSLPEIPVKVSVDNGNITAEVERAAARKARRH